MRYRGNCLVTIPMWVYHQWPGTSLGEIFKGGEDHLWRANRINTNLSQEIIPVLLFPRGIHSEQLHNSIMILLLCIRGPDVFGTRDQFHRRRFFHRPKAEGRGRGLEDDSSALHILCCHWTDRRRSPAGHVSDEEQLQIRMKLHLLACHLPPAVWCGLWSGRWGPLLYIKRETYPWMMCYSNLPTFRSTPRAQCL